MTTVTLKQAAKTDATGINLMTAQPVNINLTGLAGGGVQFTCTNTQATIQGSTTVDITYNDATHETLAVSSIIS